MKYVLRTLVWLIGGLATAGMVSVYLATSGCSPTVSKPNGEAHPRTEGTKAPVSSAERPFKKLGGRGLSPESKPTPPKSREESYLSSLLAEVVVRTKDPTNKAKPKQIQQRRLDNLFPEEKKR